jgi:hypothetical protein
MVMVRAQANGGKYIGPKVATAPKLSVLVNGQPLIQDVTIPNNNSGVVVQPQDSTSSPYPIVVQPQTVPSNWYPTPGTYWLDPPPSPDQDQAQVTVSLPLTAPTPVQFQVTAYAPHPVVSSVTVTIDPGQTYTNQPGIVVPVYGLYIPAFTATAKGGGQVDVQATVQMMCGCPITQQPASGPPPSGVEPYWPSTEFAVTAVFVSPLNPIPYFFGIPCTGENQFSKTVSVPLGSYQVFLVANQPATNNSGVASTSIDVS